MRQRFGTFSISEVTLQSVSADAAFSGTARENEGVQTVN